MHKPILRKFIAEDGCTFECDEFNSVSVYVPNEISVTIPTERMERYLLDRIMEVADILGIEPTERTGATEFNNVMS
jgi:hypothetical protein